MFALSQLDGVFCWMEAWNMRVTAGNASAAASLSILMRSSSSPVDLCGFSPARSLKTLLTGILMFDIVEFGLCPKLGRGS